MLKVLDFKNISLNLKRNDYLMGYRSFFICGDGGGELGVRVEGTWGGGVSSAGVNIKK